MSSNNVHLKIYSNITPTFSFLSWETIHEADAHKTMYKWEKNKFFRGFEYNNRFLKEEQD